MTPKAAAVSEPSLPISPTPRPLKKPEPPEDVMVRYNAEMRERVKPFYREMQQAGEAGVPLAGRPELLDQVGWLRSQGVRVQAKMRPEGTVYVLPTPPPGVNNEDAARAKVLEGSEAVAPREEEVERDAQEDDQSEQQ
jgi:hypothetical protein